MTTEAPTLTFGTLVNTTLRNISLSNVSLEGCAIFGCTLSKCDVIGCSYDKHSSFDACTFSARVINLAETHTMTIPDDCESGDNK